MRKIKVYEKGNCRAEIYKNSEWNEYVIKFYDQVLLGQFMHMPDANYHTDSKDDAIGTAKAYCNIR